MTQDLSLLITRSQVYMRDLELFFGTKPLNVYQSAVGAQLMIEVYKEVVKSVADIVQERAIREPIHSRTKQLDLKLSMLDLAKIF